MENVTTTIKQLLNYVGFREANVKSDPESKRISIFIDDETISPKNVPLLINDFNQVIKLIAKKANEGPVIVDVNNYRKERERLIIELAKASAKKAVLSKQDITLPPMNAYERRLVHRR